MAIIRNEGKGPWRGDVPRSVNTGGYSPSDAIKVGDAYTKRAQDQAAAQDPPVDIIIRVFGSEIKVSSNDKAKQ